jgi:hypothetical protein
LRTRHTDIQLCFTLQVTPDDGVFTPGDAASEGRVAKEEDADDDEDDVSLLDY